MRILIWTDAFWPEIGGLEVFCMNLAVGLERRGHRCFVIADRRNTSDQGLSRYQEIPVYGVTFWDASVRRDLPSIRRQTEACRSIIADFNPDAIHLNTCMRSALGFILQQRDGSRPAVMTIHDNLLFQNRNGMGQSVLDHVHSIAAISESIRGNTLRFDPSLGSKLHTILNALPEPELTPSPLPAEQRLLAFGRFVKEKGFDLAIRAFAQVAPRFPEATLTLAGHGNEYKNLRRLAEETGVANRVHFPGWVSSEEMPALINQHSLVIMPSRWLEPFGLVALQTAQMGRPIIASRTGGIPEIVEDGVTGKLFENDDLQSLTETLEFCLENPVLCRRLGEQAYHHARKNFSFDGFLTAYENLYKGAAADGG